MSDAETANDPDLLAAAEDELARALSLSWRELERITPWGDSFEGFSPAGRPVVMERSYLWAEEPGGDILCEVVVYANAALYAHGARRAARIAQPG